MFPSDEWARLIWREMRVAVWCLVLVSSVCGAGLAILVSWLFS
jgi:hypothetical protein